MSTASSRSSGSTAATSAGGTHTPLYRICLLVNVKTNEAVTAFSQVQGARRRAKGQSQDTGPWITRETVPGGAQAVELRATKTVTYCQALVWRMGCSRIAGHAASVAWAVMQFSKTYINGRCRRDKCAMNEYTTRHEACNRHRATVIRVLYLAPQLTRYYRAHTAHRWGARWSKSMLLLGQS